MKKIKLFLLSLVALVVTPVVAQDAYPRQTPQRIDLLHSSQ